MQVVIDIPKRIIEHIRDGSFEARPYDKYTLVVAVMNGIPLPKGHGDLIDKNDLDGEYVCSHGSEFECTSYRSCSECPSSEWKWYNNVSDAPIIIKADEGEII